MSELISMVSTPCSFSFAHAFNSVATAPWEQPAILAISLLCKALHNRDYVYLDIMLSLKWFPW